MPRDSMDDGCSADEVSERASNSFASNPTSEPNHETIPTKSDGSVDEKALQSKKVGEIADVVAGSSKRAMLRP